MKQAWDLTIEVSYAIDEGGPRCVMTLSRRPRCSACRVPGAGVSEHDGEVEQAVETVDERGWCPGCGVAARLHNRRPTWVRDLPAAGRPVTLVWVKRIWRCREARCPKVTWTETHEQIRPRASLTERTRR